MKKIGLLSSFILIYSIVDVNGLLLKHLTPRPGGIIDSLTKPKIPGGLQLGGPRLSSHLGGGISFGLGSFGFNFGFNKQYVPGGVNLPPKEPHIPEGGVPDGNPYVPGVKPEYPNENPYIPGVKPEYPNENPYIPGVKPEYPNENPYIPGVKPGYPYIPGMNPGYPVGNPYVPASKPVIPQVPDKKPSKPDMTWEDEEEEKVPYKPPPKEKDYSKPEMYEESEDYSKPGSYEDSPKREDKDSLPNWEDIGEVYNKESKSENFMNGELVADGLIQPRLNKKRNKRFIESKIYHVPLLFRSNAKPNQVKIHNNLNSLTKQSRKSH